MTTDHVSEIVTGSDGQPIIRLHRRRGTGDRPAEWQRDPPEEDGWYVAALDLPGTSDFFLHVVRLGPAEGRRAALSLSDQGIDELEAVSWWLVPGIKLPPIPKEEP